MACHSDTVSLLPVSSLREVSVGGNEAGGGTHRLRAVRDVEEAVQVLETDLGALVREVQGGIVNVRALGTIEGLLRCLVCYIWEAQATFRHLTCPVHRLPDDVLEQILFLASLRQIPSAESGQEYRDIWADSHVDKIASLNLTTVCRRWRDVALRCSALWNTMQCSPAVDIPGQLALTKPGPLELVVGPDVHVLPVGLVTTRIQSLQWIWNGRPDPLDCEASLAFCAPTLEMCVLSATSPPRRSIGKRNLHLAPFCGHAPMLRRLTLHNLPYPLQMKHDNLAGLHLHNCLYLGNARGLHQMLTSAPNLVDLVVSLDSQRRDGIVNWSQVPRAQLPRLRRLVFSQLSMAAIQRFLRLIELNPLASVRIVVPNSASETAMWHSDSSHAILRWIPAADTAHHVVAGADGSVMAVGMDAGVRIEGLQGSTCVSALSSQHLLVCLARRPSVRTLWLLQRDREASPLQSDEDNQCLLGSVDKVVVYDVGLPAVLRALDKRSQLPSSPALGEGSRRNRPSLHVLLAGSLTAEWVFHRLRQHRAQDDSSGVYDVTIGYAPSYRGPRSTCTHPGLLYHEVGGSGMTAEYITYSEEPVVPLPAVCSVPAHRLWPSWQVKSHTEADAETVRSMESPPVQAVTTTATQSQATVFAKPCPFPLAFMTPLLTGLRKLVQPLSSPWY